MSQEYINRRLIELSYLAEQGETDPVDVEEEQRLQKLVEHPEQVLFFKFG